MYFKRLEMHGFKSFADPVVIEFHEGITCIVGPNGSGKSNISDAIRWVLGEQSPKALRGGKMEEVIFAGTASRKSRGMAEVSLVIDNSAGLLKIDYSEVAITRRMYRSGESEYLINGNQCRLRDIRELIMDTGIGVDGYSIIGQGKIADIVSNKPESRREIFEEAAGVVLYKNKRGEAERRLASTAVNLDRVSDIIREIEGRIDGLKEDSEKAKEYLELKQRYESLEINVILRNIEQAEQNNRVFRSDMETLAAEIERLLNENRDLFAETENLSGQREMLDQRNAEIRDRLMVLAQEINEITNAGRLSEERLSGIESESTLLRQDVENFQDKLREEKEALAAAAREAEKLEQEKEDARIHLDEEIGIYNEKAVLQASFADQADEGRRRLFDLKNALSRAESEIKGMDGLRDNLLARKAELEQQSQVQNRDLEAVKTELDTTEVQIRAKEKEINALAEKLLANRQQRAETEKLAAAAGESLTSLHLETGKVTARRHTLEELAANYEGYQYGVRALMKEKLPGILGVAGELIEVPQGFETAIETAMGQTMQNVICAADEDAKRGIRFLKENRAGRLTFLPVASIRPGKEIDPEEIEDDPDCLGRADDLIRFDARYEDIYAYLLGRTYVVRDMDSAIRLSKKGQGLRFVTLEGEIINAAGAITGGAYKNKQASILERKAEIQALTAKLRELEQEAASCQNELERHRAEEEALKAGASSLETEKHSQELELSTLLAARRAAQERCDREMEAGKRVQGELDKIAAQLAGADEMTATQRARTEELAKEIKRLNAKIEAALDAHDQARDETSRESEKVTTARIALNELETRLESSSQLYSRIENTARDLAEQIAVKEEQLAELAKEREQILIATGDREELDRKMREQTETEGMLRKLADERERVIARQKELEGARQMASKRINDLRDDRYQMEIKCARGETQLETLKEKLWEEFEISYAQAADLRTEDFVYSRAVKDTREIRNRMKELGNVNVGAIAEYEQVAERYGFLTAQRDDILKARDELELIINDMDRKIKARFKDNFERVMKNFEEIFRELFGGGQAELRLENEDDPLNSGIEIIAQPPGKKLQNINLMSGGEKTMTAIALMFAVLKAKPTPFCILDEVEAALDDANIDRFANYLRKFNEIQFALVTHQKATMEHADVLYGVTMPERGISKVLSLRLGDDFDLGAN